MSQSIITQIEVHGLFNRFSYRLPPKAELSKAAILYGDNGVGKSTILRLVFHLLSAAGDRGHRTALRHIPFQMISVRLSSGKHFKAERQALQEKPTPQEEYDYTSWPIRLTIEDDNGLLGEWNYVPGRKDDTPMYYEFGDRSYLWNEELSDLFRAQKSSDENFTKSLIRRIENAAKHRAANKDDVKRGESAYIGLLNQLAPTMFFVNAERRLDSDAVADPSDELELRRAITHHEPKRINDLVTRAREIALKQAMAQLLAGCRHVPFKAPTKARRTSIRSM